MTSACFPSTTCGRPRFTSATPLSCSRARRTWMACSPPAPSPSRVSCGPRITRALPIPAARRLGSGELSSFVFVPEGAFAADYPLYGSVPHRRRGGWRNVARGCAYQQRVDAVSQRLNDLAPQLSASRIEQLQRDAQAELDDKRAEFEREKADAVAQMDDAQAQLDDASAQLDSAAAQLSSAAAAALQQPGAACPGRSRSLPAVALSMIAARPS